jgi:hypothetical protein
MIKNLANGFTPPSGLDNLNLYPHEDRGGSGESRRTEFNLESALEEIRKELGDDYYLSTQIATTEPEGRKMAMYIGRVFTISRYSDIKMDWVKHMVDNRWNCSVFKALAIALANRPGLQEHKRKMENVHFNGYGFFNPIEE